MATDLSLNSLAQVFALINTENATQLTEEHISLSDPVTLIQDPSEKDTAVVLVSKPNGGYKGSVEVKYNRLDLNGFTMYGEPSITIPVGGDIDDVITNFNSLYNANIELDDLALNVTVPEDIDYVGKTLNFRANSLSFAFKGNIQLDVKWESIDLSSIIVDGELRGLKFPGEPDAPTNVVAVSGESKATISFSAPADDGGADIEGYLVTSTPGGLTGTGVASPIVVSGLATATSYTFKVQAINEFGIGALSTPSNSIIPKPPLGTLLSGTVTSENNVDSNIQYTSAVVIGNKMYNITGTDNGNAGLYTKRESTVYNLDTKARVSTTADISASGRSRSHSAVFNGLIYSYGGIGSNNAAVSDFRKYNPANDTWTDVNASGISPGWLLGGGHCGVGGKMYIFGASNGSSDKTKNLYIYDSVANSWSMEVSTVTDDFKWGKMVAIDNILYIIGGGDIAEFSSATVGKAFVWSYDIQTKVWTKLASMPVGLYGHSASVVGGRIYVIGGSTTSSSALNSTVYVYNPNLNTWSTLNTAPAIPRKDHAAVVYDGKIVLVGGSSANNNTAASVYRVRLS